MRKIHKDINLIKQIDGTYVRLTAESPSSYSIELNCGHSTIFHKHNPFWLNPQFSEWCYECNSRQKRAYYFTEGSPVYYINRCNEHIPATVTKIAKKRVQIKGNFINGGRNAWVKIENLKCQIRNP